MLIHAFLTPQSAWRKILSCDMGEQPRSIQTSVYRWPASIPELSSYFRDTYSPSACTGLSLCTPLEGMRVY